MSAAAGAEIQMGIVASSSARIARMTSASEAAASTT